jgi:hypothetical protein
MRRSLFVLLLIAASAISVSAQQRFVAYLNGAQEVPANFSTGRGTCTVVLNAAQNQITVSCNFETLNANALAAHIHGNGAPGQNAPILFDLGPVPAATSGTFSPAPIAITPAQLADLRAHRMYVNLHSTGLPGGEIRGQIKQVHTVTDNDGDGRSDLTIYRTSTTEFWFRNSISGNADRRTLGLAAESFLNGSSDFDGDGRFDPLLIRLVNNQAVWTIFETRTATVRMVTWGNFAAGTNDSLAMADYDGDGKLDIAVFRRATGDWWIIDSSTGIARVEHWGTLNDFPAIGDYDGDGRADLTAVRVESGQRVWYIRNSSNGSLRREVFGASATDGIFFFMPMDRDGDGRQDIWISRVNGAQREIWVLRSSDGAVNATQWGLSTDVQLHGDYDGDGKTDFVARRNIGGAYVWYILRSSDLQFEYPTWGLTGDQLAPGDDDDTSHWMGTSGTGL